MVNINGGVCDVVRAYCRMYSSIQFHVRLRTWLVLVMPLRFLLAPHTVC